MLNQAQQDKLDILNGCEVNSLRHEGVVSIRGNKLIMNGETLEMPIQSKTVNYLWKVYCKQELG